MPPWRGRLVAGDVLEQRDERLAALPGATAAGRPRRGRPGRADRTALVDRVHGVTVEVVASGCGVGVEVGAQAAGGVVGDPGVQVGGPVAAAADGEPGRRGRAAFLGEESLVVGFLGDVGGQVLQQSGPVDPQLPGSQGGGLGHDQGLGLRLQVVTQISWEGVEGVGDHPDLGQVQVARGEGVGDAGPASVEGARPARRGVVGSRGCRGCGAASQWAVDRSPVSMAMSSAAARTRSCWAWARPMTRDQPVRASCFSAVVR